MALLILSKAIQALLFLLPPSYPPESTNFGQEVRVQLPWQPQSSQTSFVLTSQQTLLISNICTWAYRRWWAILLQWIRHAGLCCQSRTCFLATASESVALYPGHVGGEKCCSPPTWPGYKATESEPLDMKCIASVIPIWLVIPIWPQRELVSFPGSIQCKD